MKVHILSTTQTCDKVFKKKKSNVIRPLERTHLTLLKWNISLLSDVVPYPLTIELTQLIEPALTKYVGLD